MEKFIKILIQIENVSLSEFKLLLYCIARAPVGSCTINSQTN